VRIKGRRRDKGGGRVGEANQQGGKISPLDLRFYRKQKKLKPISKVHFEIKNQITLVYTL